MFICLDSGCFLPFYLERGEKEEREIISYFLYQSTPSLPNKRTDGIYFSKKMRNIFLLNFKEAHPICHPTQRTHFMSCNFSREENGMMKRERRDVLRFE